MLISKYKMDELISDILFSAMTIFVFLFNFNTNRILGVSGNTLANMSIVLFIGWRILYAIKMGGINWNRMYTFASLFFLLCFTSYIYSFAQEDSVIKIKTLAIVIVMSLCIYQYIIDHNRLKEALNIYAFSGAITALYLLYHSELTEGARFGIAIGDANLVGITLALTFSVALYLYLYERRKLYLLEAIAISYMILLTGSRTACIMLFFSIIVFIIRYSRDNDWNYLAVIFFLIGGFTFIALLITAIMKVPVLYNALGIRFLSMFQVISGRQSLTNETSTQVRLYLIHRALEWFTESPILGNGIGAFPSYIAMVDSLGKGFSHCNYTEILSSVGILGFVFYYGMHTYVIFNAVCIKNDKTKFYQILLIVLVGELLMGDFGLVIYYEKSIWILLAIVAGLIHDIQNTRN